MSRRLLTGLGGGLLAAILFLSVRTGAPEAVVLAYLSPLPLFLVGLSQGWTGAAPASAVAAIAVIVGASGPAAAMFVMLAVVPVMIVVRQGLLSRPGAASGTVEWYPPGLLLAWLTGYGLVMLIGASIYFVGQPNGLEGVMRRYLQSVLGNLGSGTTAAPDPRLGPALDLLARYLPGMMVSVWLLVAAANGAIAQAILKRAGRALRPSPPYAALGLPRWMAATLAIAVLLALVPGPFGAPGRNGVIILAMPYFLLGLAVVHVLSRRFAARGLALAAFYILLALFGWPAILAVVLGILEQWVVLRRRLAPHGTDREDV